MYTLTHPDNGNKSSTERCLPSLWAMLGDFAILFSFKSAGGNPLNLIHDPLRGRDLQCENIALYLCLRWSQASSRFRESLGEVKVLAEAKMPDPLRADA